MNIPSATVLASPNVNGWPSPSNQLGLVYLTRLDSVRLRCGSVFRSAGASTLRIAPHAASFAPCAMFNSHVQLLSFGQSFQAFHDAPQSDHTKSPMKHNKQQLPMKPETIPVEVRSGELSYSPRKRMSASQPRGQGVKQ